MQMRRTRRGAAALGMASALMVAAPAVAAVSPGSPALDVRIDRVVADPDGTTTATISFVGLPTGTTPSLEGLSITENGVAVESPTLVSEVEPSSQVVPGVVVAIDVSGSTEGAPLDAAREAAASLFRALDERGAAVGLLAFGPEVAEVATLSDGASRALAGLDQLVARGETRLYDGVSRAVRMLSQHDGPRDVVVFSDGADTESTSTLTDVLGLLQDAETRVSTVALESEEFDPSTLAALSDTSGGQLLAVDAADDLAGAFESVTSDLTNRLVVSWVAPPVLTPPTELRIEATYVAAEGRDSDTIQVFVDRLASIAPPREVPPPRVPVPVFANQVGLYVGVGMVGTAVLLLLVLALGVGSDQRRAARLHKRLSAYGTGSEAAEDRPSASMADRAASAIERLPRSAAAETWIATNIERADWPMRSSEFTLIVVMLSIGVAFVLGVLASSIAVALLGIVLGAVAPFAFLRLAVRRRQRAFSDQLSDFLQMIAGALRAGHAFTTALDGAVEEIGEPAASELRRAAVEARLGRPVDRALLGVADRMESDDLRWVVSALAVQKTVGGNLAELLSNVAATLRDRASVRRQVAALSAEGRLSGWAIGAMPFVMFIFLSVQNPDYVALLWQRGIGRLMLLAGAVFFTIGVIWLRKVVQPKF